MANYVAYPVKRVPDYLIFNAVVPAGDDKFHIGTVVELESMTGAGNCNVWTVSKPAATAKHVGLIIAADFETLADGRRPAGNPDFTTYEIPAGSVVTVVMLEKFMEFEISKDILADQTNVAAGNFLVCNGSYSLATAASSAGNPVELKIFANGYFRNGGNAGAGFIPTLFVRVE